MILEYVRLRPNELGELQRLCVEDPDAAMAYAGDLRMGDEDEEVSSRGTDADKAWAGLQHLLVKLRPPVDIVDATPFSSLAKGYDPAEMISTDVYPGIWEDDSALSYLEDYYIALVALFHAAAADHEPVLVWMDWRVSEAAGGPMEWALSGNTGASKRRGNLG